MKKIYVITSAGIVEKSKCKEKYIREISSKEELEDVIERIPYILTIQAPNSKMRKELYQMALKEFDEIAWVKVIKSSYLRVQEHHFEPYEAEYAERAKQFLYGEISIQYSIPYENVEEYLHDTIEKQLREF